jgi:hypothetical protein
MTVGLHVKDFMKNGYIYILSMPFVKDSKQLAYLFIGHGNDRN